MNTLDYLKAQRRDLCYSRVNAETPEEMIHYDQLILKNSKEMAEERIRILNEENGNGKV